MFSTCLLAGCDGFNLAGDCLDRIQSENPDASSDRTAVVVVRTCGATTSYASVVYVSRNWLGETGRLAPDELAASFRGDLNIRIVWKDDSTVLIEAASYASVSKEIVDGIKVVVREAVWDVE